MTPHVNFRKCAIWLSITCWLTPFRLPLHPLGRRYPGEPFAFGMRSDGLVVVLGIGRIKMGDDGTARGGAMGRFAKGGTTDLTGMSSNECTVMNLQGALVLS